MLRTRLWMGALLIALTVGALVFDQYLGPWYPFLFFVVLLLSLGACFELWHLLDPPRRPPVWLCLGLVAALVLANWVPHVTGGQVDTDPWPWVAGVFAAGILAAFVVEMATFEQPGGSVTRIALLVWMAGYLGVLPSFLAQLRWLKPLEPDSVVSRGTLALALAIFVPKMGDTGAYFTGRLIGRHRMTPVLSPKKTWEGAAGALVASALTAYGISRIGPVLKGGVVAALAFGVVIGIVGMVGDLAESLIKRDCQHKDASQVVPGFGGILDVVDAIVFAAPVAYGWMILF